MCFFPLRRCRGARHDGHRVLIPPPTPALPGLQLPGTALILLLIYAPGFSFESSTPCTVIQPSSPSLLYSLSLQPSLSLALPVRALPICILNLRLPPLRLFNPHINPVYGLHHTAPVSHCCLIPLPSLLSHPLSSGCPRCGGRSLLAKEHQVQELSITHCRCIPSLMPVFAPFLGLGFALCTGTEKPAAEIKTRGTQPPASFPLGMLST